MNNVLSVNNYKFGVLTLVFLLIVSTNVWAQEDDSAENFCTINGFLIQDLTSVVGGASGQISKHPQDHQGDHDEGNEPSDENEDDKALGDEKIFNPESFVEGLESPMETDNIRILIIDDDTTKLSDAHFTHAKYVEYVAKQIVGDSIPIDVESYSSNGTTPEDTLARVIDILNTYLDDYPSQTIIVNMSWVLLTCKDDIDVSDVMNNEGEVLEQIQLHFDIPLFNQIARATSVDFDENCKGSISSYCQELSNFLEEHEGYDSYEHVVDNILRHFEVYGDNSLNLIEFMLVLKGIEITESEYMESNFLAVRRKLASYIHDLPMPDPDSDEDNPLGDLWNTFQEERIIPVAAAGNFNLIPQEQAEFELTVDENNNGRRDAFPPASWDNVLAVSGIVAPDLSMWPQSNDGQVSGIAAWHKFEFGIEDEHGNPIIEYGSGTSFAAPFVSGTLAIYKSTGCPIEGLIPAKSGAYDNEFIIDALANHLGC